MVYSVGFIYANTALDPQAFDRNVREKVQGAGEGEVPQAIKRCYENIKGKKKKGKQYNDNINMKNLLTNATAHLSTDSVEGTSKGCWQAYVYERKKGGGDYFYDQHYTFQKGEMGAWVCDKMRTCPYTKQVPELRFILGKV